MGKKSGGKQKHEERDKAYKAPATENQNRGKIGESLRPLLLHNFFPILIITENYRLSYIILKSNIKNRMDIHTNTFYTHIYMCTHIYSKIIYICIYIMVCLLCVLTNRQKENHRTNLLCYSFLLPTYLTNGRGKVKTSTKRNIMSMTI